MRIQESKALGYLANRYNLEPDDVSCRIVEYLLGIPEIIAEPDGSELWAYSIESILYSYDEEEGTEKLKQIGSIFQSIFGTKGRQYEIKNLLSLVVIGDHDCPECGGLMETTDKITEVISGPCWDCEPSYRTIAETKECSHCNHKETYEDERSTF